MNENKNKTYMKTKEKVSKQKSTKKDKTKPNELFRIEANVDKYGNKRLIISETNYKAKAINSIGISQEQSFEFASALIAAVINM
jgi:hypothetical protein